MYERFPLSIAHQIFKASDVSLSISDKKRASRRTMDLDPSASPQRFNVISLASNGVGTLVLRFWRRTILPLVLAPLAPLAPILSYPEIASQEWLPSHLPGLPYGGRSSMRSRKIINFSDYLISFTISREPRNKATLRRRSYLPS